MRVVRRSATLPLDALGGLAVDGVAYAIGNFDGLHRGHRAVLAEAREAAARSRLTFGVVTFEPHPREVLSPETAPSRLTPFRRKAWLLREAGVELLAVLPFERRLMELSAEAFVRFVLCERLRARAVAAGRDFRFGHRRQGDVELLTRVGGECGISVSGMPPVTVDGEVCSSTAVRAHLEAGRIERANALLGYAFTIDGIVRTGDRRGRTIGFPTANVHPTSPRIQLPAGGVYAVRAGVESGGRTVWHPAVANLGRRPTFDGRTLLLEVHLLDGTHDLYQSRLEVAFVERLRGEVKFDGIAALKAQIERDCAEARRIHHLPAELRREPRP